jgi:aspartate aminotransferase
MKTPKISQRAKKVIASPIRKFLPLIRQAESRGVKVFKLNVGDPDLAVPPQFMKAVKSYRLKTLGYAPSPGIAEHTAAWQKYYRQFGVALQPQEIIPTVGGAEAIFLALQAVADPGDEIIVFEPLYTSYKSFSVMTGIKVVPVRLKVENNFTLPPQESIERRIGKRTRAIVVINPDNPTGKLWSRQELLTIVKIARKYGLFVICDETYREIRFSGRPFCLLSEKLARRHAILVDSVSKRFSMPGARIGCVASFNREVMQSILKFAQARLSAGTLEQLATISLLENSKIYTSKIKKEYQKRRDVVFKALKKMPGVVCHKPMGAFYLVAKLPVKNAEDFVKFMLRDFNYRKQTVMVTPMEDFYITKGLGRSEIRIAYVLNTGELKKAMEVLKKGLEAYPGRVR